MRSSTDISSILLQEKLATYTPKKQEEQTEEQRRIKEAILQVGSFMSASFHLT